MSTGRNREAVIAAVSEMVGADASRSVDAVAERINLTELALKLDIPRRSLRRLFNTVEDAAIAVRLAALDDVKDELDAICKSAELSPIKLRDVCACLTTPEHAGFFFDHRDVAVAFERQAVFFISSAIFEGGFDEGLYWAEDGFEGAAEFVLDVMRGLAIAMDRSRQRGEKNWDDARNIDRFESHMRLIMKAFDQNACHVVFTEVTELDRIQDGVQIQRRANADNNGAGDAARLRSTRPNA